MHVRLAESLQRPRQPVAHVLLQPRNLARIGRIALEIQLGQPHGAELLREGIDQPAVFAQDQLGAAAADVHDQHRLPQLRPPRLDPALHQARFLLTPLIT